MNGIPLIRRTVSSIIRRFPKNFRMIRVSLGVLTNGPLGVSVSITTKTFGDWTKSQRVVYGRVRLHSAFRLPIFYEIRFGFFYSTFLPSFGPLCLSSRSIHFGSRGPSKKAAVRSIRHRNEFIDRESLGKSRTETRQSTFDIGCLLKFVFHFIDLILFLSVRQGCVSVVSRAGWAS